MACLAAIGTSLIAGCSGGPEPDSSAAIKTPLARKSAGPLINPVVVGGDNGLELRWWVAAADEATLGGVLAPYAERTVPIDAKHRALLESNGLRLIAVPVEKLAEVQSRVSTIGAEQRQWLGQAPAWIEAVPGPVRDGGQTISMHDGPVRLGPGRLRLLIRCWTIPRAPASPGAPAAALHVEFIPQHKESSPAEHSSDGLVLTPSAVEAEDQGLLFSRLLTRLTAAQGEAFLLVPELPGTKWKAIVTESPESAAAVAKESPPAPVQPTPPPFRTTPGIGQVVRGSPDASGAAQTSTNGATTPRPATSTQAPLPAAPRTGITFTESGPPSEANPTLGEAMLTSTVQDPSPRTVRAVVILIPHVPAKYELLPREPAKPAGNTPNS